MAALVALPLLVLVSLAVVRGRARRDWRAGVLEGAVVWGALLVGGTEVLGALRLLGFTGVLAFWGIVAAIVVARVLATGGGRSPAEAPFAATGRIPAVDRGLIAALGVLLAVVLATGLLAPPNNWDSLAYHLPRVTQWIQSRSVAHFPASYTPQIEHPPFAEFSILHLVLLAGDDRFVNLVQWLSLVGCVIGVSLIAGEIGASPRGQVLAAVVAATIPMAILQGSSTQNDLVVSFWLVAFAYFLLRSRHGDRLSPAQVFYVGASLGLALLTKGTAFFFAFPLGVWLAASWLRRFSWRALAPGVAALGIALALNAGHFSRNVAILGRPVSDGGDAVNRIRTPAAVASVVIRNLSLHVGTPSERVNGQIYAAIRALHRPLGLDVDDRRTTDWGTFEIHRTSTYEDQAGNPLHLALMLLAVVALARQRALRGDVALLVMAVGAGFLLFCIMMKFQPWHSRLQTPLFLLMAPAVGLALEGLRWPRAATTVAVLLLLASLPWAFLNRQRPIVSLHTRSGHYPSILVAERTHQYFAHPFARPYEEPYREVAEVLGSRGGDVGLLLPWNAFEYPLWVLLRRGNTVGRIGNVGVTNRSAAAATEEPFRPGSVVRVREARPDGPPPSCEAPAAVPLEIDGTRYERVWCSGPVDLFERHP